jgi:phage-related protein
MNEELKIIIKAVTDSAKKEISKVGKELEGLGASAQGASGKIGAAMKGAAVAATAVVAAITAVTTAIVILGKKSLQAQKEHAQLVSSFQAAGSTAEQAATSYNKLYRFLGESDRATEAASLLAKITTNEKDLAEWTSILQDVYATFPDSLPIESLAEAANETIRVGKVTGTMADALNWAGASEDEFNAKLATTTSYQEREALVRNTLNGLYKDAAAIYEQNNKALLDYNESQARTDAAMAEAGAVITPLLTALNNLSTAFFAILKPALEVIIPPLVTFVNMITKALESVLGLFGAVSGKSASITTTFKGAAKGAGNLASGLKGSKDAGNGVNKQLQEIKRTTQGFDELNILSSGKSGSSSGSSSGGGGSTSPAGGSGYSSPLGSTFGVEAEETKGKASGLAESIKNAFSGLEKVFEPTIKAWSGAFGTIKKSWNEAKPHFTNGAKDIQKAFEKLGKYILKDFVPKVVNSFSKNIAPVIGDVFGAGLKEAGKQFEWIGKTIKKSADGVIIPALEVIGDTATDVFDSIGQAWEEHGGELLSNFSTFFENLRGHFDGFYENAFKPVWDNILAVFSAVWDEHLKPLVDKFVDAFLTIGNEILVFYNEVLAPVVDWVMANIYPVIVEFINKIVEIVGKVVGAISDAIGGIIDFIKGLVQFVVGVFTADWEKAWEGIKNMFSGVWDFMVGVINTVKEIFTGVKDFIKGAFAAAFKTAWETIKGVWSGVTGWFGKVWDGIKQVFSKVGTFFSDTFSKAWEKVKGVFSKGGKVFDGIKEGIVTTFKTIVNALITGINKVVKEPFKGLNAILDKLQNLSFLGISPFTWISWRIPIPEIPMLAKGGLVDSATLAMIGERGKEAVLPLENNTEWMDKLADRIAARNNTPSKIVLMVDKKVLGEASINSINDITRQTGKLQLAFA